LIFDDTKTQATSCYATCALLDDSVATPTCYLYAMPLPQPMTPGDATA